MRALWSMGLLVAVGSLWSGCSSSSTNPASTGGAGGIGGAGGADAAVGGSSGSAGDASVDVPAPTCDPSEKPDSKAVFVSPNGDDTTGSGSEDKPLASLGQAIKVAAASALKLVIADQGTYKEGVTIDSKVAGVAIRGGYQRTGSVWSRDCDPQARKKTVIDSPSNIGVRINDVEARLETLTVLTKATGATSAGASGESQYGVFVTGDDASVSLIDVRVVAGAGGDGGAALKTIPASVAACNGLTNCGNGAAGTQGAAGSDAPPAAFDPSGHLPGNGEDAKPASPGKNGAAGQAGGTKAGCMGKGCAGVCSDQNCAAYGPQHQETGGTGTCGCGGPGGASGGGGWGGGASVALFVAGKGVVAVAFSELTCLDGGKGSPGKSGEPGSVGANGGKGADTTCWGACSSEATCGNCAQAQTTAGGGAKGGPGGTGGDGARGGDAAGGPSIAVVRIGGALVTLSNGSLPNPSKGGLGAGNAPAGKSANELILSADGGTP